MPIPTQQRPTVQVLVTSAERFALLEPVADISATDAKLRAFSVPKLGAGWWPLWQFTWYFSAGTAKTADVILHVQDPETGHWHALTKIALMHSDAVTDSTSQVMQFEAPPNHDRFALEIDLTNADERPHITVRGAAWVTLPLDGATL